MELFGKYRVFGSISPSLRGDLVSVHYITVSAISPKPDHVVYLVGEYVPCGFSSQDSDWQEIRPLTRALRRDSLGNITRDDDSSNGIGERVFPGEVFFAWQ